MAAKRDGIFLAGKLRMISSGLLVISLLFRSGSSHSSLETSDALSSPDWIWTLSTGTTFCLAEHERVDLLMTFTSDIIDLSGVFMAMLLFDVSPKLFFMNAAALVALSSLTLLRCAKMLSVLLDIVPVCGCFSCPLKKS